MAGNDIQNRIRTVKAALKSGNLTKKQIKAWQKRLAGLEKELKQGDAR